MNGLRIALFALVVTSGISCSSQPEAINPQEPLNPPGSIPVGTIESLSSAYLKNGNVKSARETISRIPQRQYSAHTWLLLAQIYLLEGNSELADSAFTAALGYSDFGHYRIDITSLINLMCETSASARINHYLQIVVNSSDLNLHLNNLIQTLNCLRDTERMQSVVWLLDEWPFSQFPELNLHKAQLELIAGYPQKAKQSYAGYLPYRRQVTANSLWQELTVLRATQPDKVDEKRQILVSLFPESDFAAQVASPENVSQQNHQPMTLPTATKAVLSSHSDNMITHAIKSGDTIYGLSKRYKVEVAHIISANPGIDIYSMAVGHVVNIPLHR